MEMEHIPLKVLVQTIILGANPAVIQIYCQVLQSIIKTEFISFLLQMLATVLVFIKLMYPEKTEKYYIGIYHGNIMLHLMLMELVMNVRHYINLVVILQQQLQMLL